MGPIWNYIVSQTAGSPMKLLAFGGICIAASVGLGGIFTRVAVPANTATPLGNQQLQQLGPDEKRTATAREQRLSSMIKDMVEGRADEHWSAAMRGTLVHHPGQESKTQGIDREKLAKALEAAAQAKDKDKDKGKGWFGWGK